MDVFDRMEMAYSNGQGIELSHSDLSWCINWPVRR